MIISFKEKFIFVKPRKLAGTSIEVALSSICGNDDIITPVSPVDELQRIDLMHCRNYDDDKQAEAEYIAQLKMIKKFPDLDVKLRDIETPEGTYFNHMSLKRACALIKQDISDFTVIFPVRDPYATIISLASWRIANKEGIFKRTWPVKNSDKATKKYLNKNIDACIKTVRDNFELCSGYKAHKHVILRYENLQDDFNGLLKAMGYPPITLPHLKKSTRLSTDPGDFFYPKQINLVYDSLKEYFMSFGYQKPTGYKKISASFFFPRIFGQILG
ncbi:MAG: hypothetical protein LBH42_08980 [Treponema sp.]|jgi:hypothetical protein|nr:hypothetical protein [Treponema sp.]